MPSDDVGTTESAIIRSTSLGGRNEVVMVYAMVDYSAQGQPIYRTCSGAYFAPRVVVTAAHCLQDVAFNQLFVYWGDSFTQDASQLTGQGVFRSPPPVGSPSFWAQAESFEQHPSWDPNLFYPDLGVIYLDRKPPFDPLPLARFRLDHAWKNRQVTISGWGADTVMGPTTATGARVQRTGRSRFLGSPTEADYHADDPNPGMLDATVRSNVFKIDGRAPNSNNCFGDSGGPLLVNHCGQTYIGGVEYFGGLYCEDYSLYTRLDPFLPFLDLAYTKGGQAQLVPELECIAPRTGGGFRAFFGYDNENGIAIDIPFGTKNAFPQDTASIRPSTFLPGDHDYVFGIDLDAGQTLSYRVTAPSGPNTLLTVTQNSPICDTDDRQVICAQACDAEMQAQCGWKLESCTRDCFSDFEFIAPCETQFESWKRCLGTLPASAFQCDDIFAYDLYGTCDPALFELFACIGG